MNKKPGRKPSLVVYQDRYWILSGLCAHHDINKRTFVSRMRMGWTVEDALQLDVDPTKRRHGVELHTFRGEARTLSQWAKISGLPYNTIRARVQNGWSVEKALTTPTTTRVYIARESRLGGYVETFEQSSQTAFCPPRDTAPNWGKNQ